MPMYVLFGTERTSSSAFGQWAFTRAYAAQSFVVGDSVTLLLERPWRDGVAGPTDAMVRG
jgi:hypothetical protein